MTTFFGKAATNRVPARPPPTLPVTTTDSKSAHSLSMRTIALAAETEKVVSETRKEMNKKFGQRVGEMVLESSPSSSAHTSTTMGSTIPVEEIICNTKLQHVERTAEARDNIEKMLLSSALSKMQRMSSFTAKITHLLTEYRYEMHKSTKERIDAMQKFWGPSHQDRSYCEKVNLLTSSLIQGMVGVYSLTGKYRNEIAKLRLQVKCSEEALHDLERELAGKNAREQLPEIAMQLAAVIGNQGEKSSTLISIVFNLLTNSIKESKRWNDDTKSFFAVVLDYGGPALLRIIREKIGGPSLQTAYVTARSKFHTPTKLEASIFVKAASFYDRIGYHGPFIIAIDATAILPSIRVQGNKLIGIATEEDVVVKTAQDIIDITGNESMEKARLANAIVLTPLKEHVPCFVLAVSAAVKGQNFETVVNWFNSAVNWGAQQNLKILGIGADGDSKFRKYYFERFLKRREHLNNVISIPHKGFNFVSVVEDIHGITVPTLMFPDWKHLIKKWRNQILNVRRGLVLGNGFVMIEDLIRLYERNKLTSGLWKSDVFVRDRQNVDAALRILQPQVRQCLQDWNDQRTEATRTYLKIGHNMMRSFTEENLPVKERAKLAWSAVCFVRLWKAWIEMSSYSIETSFISLQTYNDMILAGHTLVLSMKLFSKHFPDEPFHPKVFGSDSCERLFARLRGFYRGKSNLCMLDILDICGRILKLEELRYKEVPRKQTQMSWSTNTEQEILSGLQEAEREVLKTVEQLGMLPLLTAGNILRKDKDGEIVYLNPGMESTLTDIGVEPDELDSIPLQELIEAESDVLCSVAEENDHSSAYALSDIAASAQTSVTAQTDLLEDEDDDDPSHCHLFQSGKCKYMDGNFKAPAKTHWLGCDYPGCENWFHESCLGLKFQSDFERENYAFVCKAHDSVKDMFNNQVTATTMDLTILDEEQSEGQPPSKRLRRTQYKEGSSLFTDQTVRPNYVEYEGEYYHIAEFLSLHQGKVYNPSASRMSRWMAVSRNDFYERVEKLVSPNKPILGSILMILRRSGFQGLV